MRFMVHPTVKTAACIRVCEWCYEECTCHNCTDCFYGYDYPLCPPVRVNV